MMTRLRVQNFKNLRDVEVYFGPLTVMAGPNGVGKSNLLDAIQFLGNTAAMTLTQAALKVRSKDANNTDVRKLFFADGASDPQNIKFEADLILLPSAQDKLMQTAHASSRFVTYSIEIAWSSEPLSTSPLKLVSENLRSKSLEHLPEPFFHLRAELQKTNAGHRYIASDEPYKFEIMIEAQQLKGPILSNFNEKSASVLFRVNGGGYPTATVVQQELQSWSAFQLYPDQLMRPTVSCWGQANWGKTAHSSLPPSFGSPKPTIPRYEETAKIIQTPSINEHSPGSRCLFPISKHSG